MDYTEPRKSRRGKDEWSSPDQRADRHRPDRHCRREICDEKFALIACGLMLVRRDPGTSVVAKCLIEPNWIGSKQYETGRLLIKSARWKLLPTMVFVEASGTN